jgi:hypothetical protein
MSIPMNWLKLSIVTLLFLGGCQDSSGNLQGMSQPKHQKPVSNAQRAELKLLPTDDASQDPSFELFRQNLLTAAKNHDVNSILGILDHNVMNNLGGNGGIQEFKEQWKLDKPNSELWNTLSAVLTMGGSFSDNEGTKEYCAPYVSSKWSEVVNRLPEGSDPLDYAVITGSNVGLRKEPSMNSPILDNLSYDVVQLADNDGTRRETAPKNVGWVKIVTLRGVMGYVSGTDIRGPGDYHACFRKNGSRWLMTALLAGD